MVFFIIGLLILLYGFFNLKKSLLLFLCFRLFLTTNVTLISIPGLPLLTLDLFLSLAYCGLFTMKCIKEKRYQMAAMRFPFQVPFALMVLSMTLSAVFGIAGFKAEFTRLIAEVTQELLIVWMIWQMVEDEEDFTFLFKGITLVILGSCLYAFFEYFTKSNPLQVYELSLNPSKPFDYSYRDDPLRGYRVSSIFEHTIGAGMIWAVYTVFTVSLFVQRKKIPNVIVVLTTSALCVVCILLTKMRSPLFFLVIALLGVINFREKRFYYLVAVGVVCVIVCWPMVVKILATFQSFFSKDSDFLAGGSNFKMKLSQFTAGFALMQTSPLIGLGAKFETVMSNALTAALLGTESIWLHVMPENGLLGMVAYLALVVYMVFLIPLREHNKTLFFLALAYWVTYTITSLPGFHEYLLYLVFFYYIKTGDRYKTAKSKLTEPVQPQSSTKEV